MRIAFYFLFIVIAFSCSSNDDVKIEEEISIEDPSLIGKWLWISSCGGITGDCWYPPVGYKETMTFGADSTFIEMQDDIVSIDSRYLITDTLAIGSQRVYTINFEYGFNTEFIFKGDTLSITLGDYWGDYVKDID